jgi:hypothetical protein
MAMAVALASSIASPTTCRTLRIVGKSLCHLADRSADINRARSSRERLDIASPGARQ